MSFEDQFGEQRREEQERLDKLRLDELHRDNPSLCWEDLKVVLRQEKEAKIATKCCSCRSAQKAEIVRVGAYLGLCKCKTCHRVYR